MPDILSYIPVTLYLIVLKVQIAAILDLYKTVKSGGSFLLKLIGKNTLRSSHSPHRSFNIYAYNQFNQNGALHMHIIHKNQGMYATKFESHYFYNEVIYLYNVRCL